METTTAIPDAAAAPASQAGYDDRGEVVGTFRWLAYPGPDGRGRLRINDAEYDVRRLPGHPPAWMVGGWKVTTGPRFTCSCPDFRYRRANSEKGCKHCASLQAALGQLSRV